MKKTILSLALCLGVAATAFAGTATSGKAFKQVIDEPTPCFRDSEVTLDVFAVYQTGGDQYFADGWGGGVGVNYFFARYFGLGIEGYWNDALVEDSVLHNFTGSLILRYPMDSICLAPYIFCGAGGHLDSENKASGHLGGGLEYRVAPTWGLFGDGRYVMTGDNSDENFSLFRLGVRFAF